jgi:small ligand-binding sensory domain FIST
MIQGELAVPAGAVGLTISGPVAVDLVVSQGCRPVGQAMVITKVKNNVILEIGGRKALEVIQEMAQALPERERPLLAKGLFAGLVTNEYKDRFGRGDFLVRNILAADKGAGSIAVGDVPRVGQTIQFHVRDAETAEEDLQLLLDAQELKDPPFAGLLFTCNGRGTRLFAKPNHDVNVIRQRLGSLPLAGFFAAGEIGPIGDRSFVHGQTASLALFRGG